MMELPFAAPEPTLAARAAATLLTWWIHAGLAAIMACAIARRMSRPADRDLVWKGALVLPLVTTMMAVMRPFGFGALHLPDLLRALLPDRWPGPIVIARMTVDTGHRVASVAVTDPLAEQLVLVVVFAAAMTGLPALALQGWRRLQLARVVRQRRELHDDLCTGTRIVLAECEHLDSPVAIGARTVCVPTSFGGLGPSQRRSILAHEIAHLERRDPRWFLVADVVAAIGSIQPLVRLVVRGLRRDAEFICDDHAVHTTGEREGLVESLALLTARFDPAARPTLIGARYHGSPVVERARRILAPDRVAAPMRPVHRLLLVGGAGALLIALAGAAPRLEPDAQLPPRGAQVREHVTEHRIITREGDERAIVTREIEGRRGIAR